MHQPGATEETKLHCLKLGSNPSLYEECILVKMKPVVLELVSLLSVVIMTSAWLQKAPCKVENGFLGYRSFIPSFNRSLSATKILISLSEDKLYCGFECLAEAKCVSFNIAGNPDSNGFFLCELLNTDILSWQLNASFHHFGSVSHN